MLILSMTGTGLSKLYGTMVVYIIYLTILHTPKKKKKKKKERKKKKIRFLHFL